MAKQAKNKNKSVLDWLVPVICVVVVLGALAGILIGPIQNGIDNIDARNTVLFESEDGEITLTRTTAQAVTWLELFNSFQDIYSSYSYYHYLRTSFSESGIDDTSLMSFAGISSENVSWIESNLYYLSANLGLTLYMEDDVTKGGRVTSEDVANSAVLFAAYMASGTESNLGSYMTSTLESLKRYVSVAAAAKAAGVTLDDENTTDIKTSMDNFRSLPELISYKGSLKKFIKDFVGNAVKESDIQAAYELMALASKYNTQISNNNYDTATDADRAAYVEENKGSFYTAKILKYTTKNAELVDLFKAATDKDTFIAVAAKEILDKKYASLVATWEKENLLKTGDTPEDYEEEIVGAGFGDLVTYEKGVNDPAEEALASAIFKTDDRSVGELYLVEGETAVYLVWFKSASTERSEVRVKAFPYAGLESYDDIEDFRQSLYSDVLASLNSESGTTVYSYESTSYTELVKDALEAVEAGVPSQSTITYVTDADEGSLDAWISSEDRKAGDIYSAETTEDDAFVQCELVFVISPMALDEEVTVNGGYLKYDTEDEAKEGKNELAGETGIALVSAMKSLSSSAVISSNLRESDFDSLPEALKNWFFSEDRQMNDVAILVIEPEVTESEETEEGEEEAAEEAKPSIYLVCYRSTMKAWESSATSGFANKKTSDWMEALEKTVKVNEKALEKLGVDLNATED